MYISHQKKKKRPQKTKVVGIYYFKKMEWKGGGGEENRKTIQGWIWSKLCAHMEMLQQISLHQIMSILNEKMNIDKQKKKGKK